MTTPLHRFARLAPALLLPGCLGLEAFNSGADTGSVGADSGGVVWSSFGGMGYPDSVDFGDVAVGQPASTEVVLVNESDANVTLSEIVLDAPATFQADYTSVPWVIGTGGEYVVTLTWTPGTTGSETGTLSFGLDGVDGLADISLKGNGVTEGDDSGGGDGGGSGDLTYSTTDISFGTVGLGSSQSRTVTLSNPGDGAVEISSITSSDPVFSTTGMTAPTSIAAGDSSTLTVRFTPTREQSYSGNITVESEAGPTNIRVTGTGEEECVYCSPIIDVDTGGEPYSMEFFSIFGFADTKEVQIYNLGDEDLVVSNVYVNNDSSEGSFRVSGGTGTVRPGSGTSFTVSYTCPGDGCLDLPLDVFDTNILHIRSNDDSNDDWKIELTGAGI